MALMLLSASFGTLIMLVIARRMLALLMNWRRARSLPFPYVIAPWADNEMIWRLLAPQFTRVFGRRLRFIQTEIFWTEKGKLFDLMGSDVFMVISPYDIKLFNRDMDLTREMCANHVDWAKPVKSYKFFELYGRNVITTEGTIWHRQKKVISAAFAERNNEIVWQETQRQVSTMVASWHVPAAAQAAESTIHNTLRSDLHTTAMNVISWAGFGQKVPWRSTNTAVASKDREMTPKTVESGFKLSLEATIQLVMRNILLVVAAPISVLRFFSPKFNDVFVAHKEFPLRIKETIEERKLNMATKAIGTPGLLLDEMIKSHQEMSKQDQRAEEANIFSGLTEDELVGNVFTFYIAGMETTSGTLEFALYALAVFPNFQTKLQAEIDKYKKLLGGKLVADWTYTDSVGFLYATAIMFETLRLFPIVQGLPKRAATSKASVFFKGGWIRVPTGTRITVDTVAVHYHRGIWGPDAEQYNPDRWVKSKDNIKGASELYKPPKGAFIAFSEGTRSCVGRRFAETEFKCILAYIFETHSVELQQHIDPLSGKVESWETARERALAAMNDGTTVLTFSMKNLVPLRLVKRAN